MHLSIYSAEDNSFKDLEQQYLFDRQQLVTVLGWGDQKSRTEAAGVLSCWVEARVVLVLQVTGKLHPKHLPSQLSVGFSKVEEIKKPRKMALNEVQIRLFKLSVFHPLVLLN